MDDIDVDRLEGEVEGIDIDVEDVDVVAGGAEGDGVESELKSIAKDTWAGATDEVDAAMMESDSEMGSDDGNESDIISCVLILFTGRAKNLSELIVVRIQHHGGVVENDRGQYRSHLQNGLPSSTTEGLFRHHHRPHHCLPLMKGRVHHLNRHPNEKAREMDNRRYSTDRRSQSEFGLSADVARPC